MFLQDSHSYVMCVRHHHAYENILLRPTIGFSKCLKVIVGARKHCLNAMEMQCRFYSHTTFFRLGKQWALSCWHYIFHLWCWIAFATIVPPGLWVVGIQIPGSTVKVVVSCLSFSSFLHTFNSIVSQWYTNVFRILPCKIGYTRTSFMYPCRYITWIDSCILVCL